MRNEQADQDLDDLFAEARAVDAPSDALMARVLADAQNVQRQTHHVREDTLSRLSDLIDRLFGGWSVVSGAAMAGIAGLLFGVGLSTLNPDMTLSLQEASGWASTSVSDFGDPWALADLGGE
jgi:hypothetical protein